MLVFVSFYSLPFLFYLCAYVEFVELRYYMHTKNRRKKNCGEETQINLMRVRCELKYVAEEEKKSIFFFFFSFYDYIIFCRSRSLSLSLYYNVFFYRRMCCKRVMENEYTMENF